jgi:hypothetical protein
MSHCTLSCGVDARRAATKHSDARLRQSVTVIFIAAAPRTQQNPRKLSVIFARACDGFVPI